MLAQWFAKVLEHAILAAKQSVQGSTTTQCALQASRAVLAAFSKCRLRDRWGRCHARVVLVALRMALSTYELSRLDNMAQNQRKLTCLGLVQAPAAHPKQARRRAAAAPELVTARRASERRSEASPRRYDTLHLFGRDVAEWPLPGVRRSHTLLLVRLVLRGHEGQARPGRLAAAAGVTAGAAARQALQLAQQESQEPQEPQAQQARQQAAQGFGYLAGTSRVHGALP
mgnify:CR=1 FL=1